MNFKKWMKTPKKLAIYDFDSTLALSPEKPTDWKHIGKKDWWTHKDSLTMPYYDGRSLNQLVVKAFRKDKMDPQTKTVLLTGRSGEISWLVRQVLARNSLYGKRVIPDSNTKAAEEHEPNHEKEAHPHAHEEYFKGDFFNEPDYPKTATGKIDNDTFSHKSYVVSRLMNDDFEFVEIWDDREEHLQSFINLGHKILETWPNLHNVLIHHVQGDKIEDIPLRKFG